MGAVIADDWEIQEPAVTITRTQLYQALEDVESRLIGFNWDALAKRLGLGEP